MKKLKHISQIIFGLYIVCSLWTCSSNDSEDQNDEPQSQGNYITYSVTGSAVNDTFIIADSERTSTNNIIVLGHVYDQDTPEGTMQVASLGFSRHETEDNYFEVYITAPNSTGEFALGEIETGTTGIITDEPIFNMKLLFGNDFAFYDSDGDSDNDLITSLYSKAIGVTITEYEETLNSLGIVTIANIKGSFEGQAYFKAFTDGILTPEVLLHNVTGEFEYNVQAE
ncbi:hypothetical protein [Winogradskyella schleiferi]|uniref:hypothetical protein n=1 Tax=Winogradskyella schleiferi TaxID=2686078 RepID=UPI0015B82DB4|nr:hypothetical protein [Winogradskyella schleiferi]